MERIVTNIKFQCPFGGIISGPSLSGKTSFTFEMLSKRKELFDPVPERIVYVYGIWQKAYEDHPNIEFVAGIDKILDETVQFDSSVNNMLILDDVMHEVAEKKKAATLFTRDMHHKNVSVWFILQNLYKQGPSMRDIVLNCQLFILFKSPRDVSQIKLLSRQLSLKNLVKAYEKSIKVRFGYLVINLQPTTHEKLVLQSNIFDPHRTIYY